MSENVSKTVVVFSVNIVGHMNPIIATVNELIVEHKKGDDKTNLKVIVYSSEQFKSIIEATGAQFRAYEPLDINLNFKLKMCEFMVKIAEMMQESLEKNILLRVNELEQDNPDIIIYDNGGAQYKWFIRLLKERYREKNMLSKFPKVLSFSTTFCNLIGIYPSSEQTQQALSSEEMISAYMKIDANFRKLAVEYNVPYVNPFEEIGFADPEFENIVYVIPEFHPCSDLYPKNVKFVGASIDSKLHAKGIETPSNDSVNYILNTFPPINPQKSTEEIYSNKSKKLIVVSLGSIIQDHIDVYLNVIKAIETFDEEPIDNSTKTGYRFKKDDLCVLLTLGNKCYEEFKSGDIKMPDNIHITPSIPQIEILKRASLFLTHNGMNSTSESIHYGVPMVCLPLTTDQPAIANRVANELGLGKYLKYDGLTYTQIRSAIHDILENPEFYERSIKFSEFSSKNAGQIVAAKIILKAM